MPVKLSQLQVIVEIDTRQAEKALKNIEQHAQRSAGEVGRAFSGTGGILSNALSFATGMAGLNIVTGALNAVGGAIKDLASTGIEFNRLKENAQIGFTTMLGGADKAKQHLKDLLDFARNTPFEAPQMIEASRMLQAVGFKAAEVIPTLRAVGDALSASGNMESLGGVVRQLGQIQSKGRVTAEDIGTLAENGIPAWDMLAHAIGKTVGETRKLSEAGMLSGAESVQALLAEMTSRFGGQMKQMEGTLTGLQARRSDLLRERAGEAMGPAFEGLKGAERIAGDLLESQAGKDMADKLAKMSETPIKAMTGSLTAIASGDFETAARIAGQGFIDTLTQVWSTGAPILAKALDPLVTMLGAKFDELSNKVANLFNDKITGPMNAAIGKAEDAIANTVVAGVQGFKAGQSGQALSSEGKATLGMMLGTLGQGGQFALPSVTGMLATPEGAAAASQAAGLLGRSVKEGFIEGMVKTGGDPGAAIITIVGNVISTAKDLLKVKSPSQVFIEIGQNVALGFQQGIASYTGLAVSAINQMMDQAIAAGKGKIGSGAGFNRGVTPDLSRLIRESSAKSGIDADLLQALLKQESGFAEDVISGQRRSRTGAAGIAQFMAPTARAMGLKVNDTVDERLDPAKAIPAAAELLSNLLKKYGDLGKALAAYNAGEGAVDKYGGIPPFTETQNYVKSITAMLQSVKAAGEAASGGLATVLDPKQIRGSFGAALPTGPLPTGGGLNLSALLASAPSIMPDAIGLSPVAIAQHLAKFGPAMDSMTTSTNNAKVAFGQFASSVINPSRKIEEEIGLINDRIAQLGATSAISIRKAHAEAVLEILEGQQKAAEELEKNRVRLTQTMAVDPARLNDGVARFLASQKTMGEAMADFRENGVRDTFSLFDQAIDRVGIKSQALSTYLKDLAHIGLTQVLKGAFGFDLPKIETAQQSAQSNTVSVGANTTATASNTAAIQSLTTRLAAGIPTFSAPSIGGFGGGGLPIGSAPSFLNALPTANLFPASNLFGFQGSASFLPGGIGGEGGGGLPIGGGVDVKKLLSTMPASIKPEDMEAFTQFRKNISNYFDTTLTGVNQNLTKHAQTTQSIINAVGGVLGQFANSLGQKVGGGGLGGAILGGLFQGLVNFGMGMLGGGPGGGGGFGGGFSQGIKGFFGGGKAGGGSVSGGVGYMVGESGPEAFIPGRDGTIVPNSQLKGGGVTINQTINVKVEAPQGKLAPESTQQIAVRVGAETQRAVQRYR